jgi:hypothetical protein
LLKTFYLLVYTSSTRCFIFFDGESREIRGSERHLIVGIDVAKEKHHVFFGAATWKALLKRLVFENDADDFEKLLRHVEAEKVKDLWDVRAGIALLKICFMGIKFLRICVKKICTLCTSVPLHGFSAC